MSGETYLWIKGAHVSCVVLSITLYLARWYGRDRGLGWVHQPVARWTPHGIDTLLLLSATALAVGSHQYPLQQAWLTAKVIGLVLYIVLGAWALRAPDHCRRVIGLVLAVAVFGYIVAVALTRQWLPL